MFFFVEPSHVCVVRWLACVVWDGSDQNRNFDNQVKAQTTWLDTELLKNLYNKRACPTKKEPQQGISYLEREREGVRERGWEGVRERGV